jgi:molybdate transport system substrate-binding protein
MTIKPRNYRRSAILAGLLLTLSSQVLADALTVAVAASAQYAFADLHAAFNEKTGHKLKPVVGSSGKLSAQIMHGAPFDVLLSADMEYPEKLHAAGFASAPKVYAYGALVLWTLNDFDLGSWQQLLRDPTLRRIAIASPKTAPYGRETMNMLAHFKLDQALKPKLVIGESVSQVNQYVHSRAADAGFTAKSVVMSPDIRGQGKWIELPSNSYQPIAQGIAVLKHGEQNSPKTAQQFHDFMLSPSAHAILERYGYLLP